MIQQVLKNIGINSLNEMQQASLEAHRENQHIVLLSPTGSGKTLAFLLPLLDTLDPRNTDIQALIITPSRELALQIEDVFRSLKTGYKVMSCYGGHDINVEIRSLSYPPALLIGTPGRLLDHFKRGSVNGQAITTVILDEFDKSLEMGFIDEMQQIFFFLPRVTRKTLTSATHAVEIPPFTGVTSPRVLDYLQDSIPAVSLKTVRSDGDKLDTLYRLLCELDEAPVLIFCNFRERAEEVSNYLWDREVDNEFFHGGMEQDERERALCKFRNGSTNLFISTDLASRGLDIPEIKYIIHYHLPKTEEAFIHRNGRTARMNASGTAFLLIDEEDNIPEYLSDLPATHTLTGKHDAPPTPRWTTLYIAKGKKDKVNKMDIVGFLCQKGQLLKEDIGKIEVKDYHSYVAVRRGNIRQLLARVRNEKIKNMKDRKSVV